VHPASAIHKDSPLETSGGRSLNWSNVWKNGQVKQNQNYYIQCAFFSNTKSGVT